MSAKQFLLTVVTPDKSFMTEVPVTSVGAFGQEGAFTALPGHMPFLTSLKPGVVSYRDSQGEMDNFFVSGGFVEVLPNKVTILADSAEILDEIDLERAEKSRQRAQQRLADAKKLSSGAKASEETPKPGDETAEEKKDRIDIMRAEIALAKATARTRIARNKSKYQHKKM
ncbi:MAG: ATP synthase F1 subunit epsilon [Deltaproteobacteria bacterium]|jgi:F-type H+-transporting ATPase subunit epsilon|nr:ATP synthase F1 subunit epsilon [Deltaproteobacteria bacterium]